MTWLGTALSHRCVMVNCSDGSTRPGHPHSQRQELLHCRVRPSSTGKRSRGGLNYQLIAPKHPTDCEIGEHDPYSEENFGWAGSAGEPGALPDQGLLPVWGDRALPTPGGDQSGGAALIGTRSRSSGGRPADRKRLAVVIEGQRTTLEYSSHFQGPQVGASVEGSGKESGATQLVRVVKNPWGREGDQEELGGRRQGRRDHKSGNPPRPVDIGIFAAGMVRRAGGVLVGGHWSFNHPAVDKRMEVDAYVAAIAAHKD